ncbi:MAG: hypothetical protein ACKVRP_03260 [Bacteroidota bacterium]
MDKLGSKKNYRKTLFLDVVNAPTVDEEFVSRIKEGFPQVGNLISSVSTGELIEVLNEAKGELTQCLREIIENPGNGDSLAAWLTDRLYPIVTVSRKFTFDVELNPSDEAGTSFVEEWMAEEIYWTFKIKTFFHLKSCQRCHSIFVASNMDAVFCSDTCRRKEDYWKNRFKYRRLLQLRRRGQIYLPEKFFRCYGCKNRISVRNPRTGQLLTSKQIRCNHCGQLADNPHATNIKKQQSRKRS